MIDQLEKTQRLFVMQASMHGCSIDSRALALDAEEEEVLSEEEKIDALAFAIDDSPTWEFEKREYRVSILNIETWTNWQPTGGGPHIPLAYPTREEAINNALPGCTRVAIKMVPAENQELVEVA